MLHEITEVSTLKAAKTRKKTCLTFVVVNVRADSLTPYGSSASAGTVMTDWDWYMRD